MFRITRNVLAGLLFIGIAGLSPFLIARLNLWPNTHAASEDSKRSLTQVVSYAEAVTKAAPAVISVHTTRTISIEEHPLFQDPFFRHFFGDPSMGGRTYQEQQPGLGSGVIIDTKGTILTNNHVIHDATEILVRLDGREAKARVIGADPDSDLAVLKIDLEDLPTIVLGDSEKLRVGDIVLAIGNPFGVGQTVTQGIVSATERTGLGLNAFENFIQTDASINPGNSGGALIDTEGRLVGINTAIFSRTGGNLGIGFAIPVRAAHDVMMQIVDSGHVIRGWIGITIRQLTDDMRKSLSYEKGEGTVVDGVMRDGPAHKAGLLPGDVIVSINKLKTPTPTQLRTVVSALKPGKSFPIEVVREGKTYDFRITIASRPTKQNREEKSGEKKR